MAYSPRKFYRLIQILNLIKKIKPFVLIEYEIGRSPSRTQRGELLESLEFMVNMIVLSHQVNQRLANTFWRPTGAYVI